MEGICPKCLTRLELPEPGAYQCQRCRTRFDVALGPPPPAGVPGGPYQAGAGLTAGPAWAPPAAAGVTGVWTGPAGPAFGAGTGPAPAALQAPCSMHPMNLAVRVCDRCGDFICGLCVTPMEGRAYCPKCFDLLHGRGAFVFQQRQFTLPSSALALAVMAMLASLFGFCFFIVSLPLGIGAAVYGSRAMKAIQERPDLPGRGASQAAVIVAGVSLVVTAGWIVFDLFKLVEQLSR